MNFLYRKLQKIPDSKENSKKKISPVLPTFGMLANQPVQTRRPFTKSSILALIL